MAVKLITKAGRDGNGYEFLELERGTKVIRARRLYHAIPEDYVPEEEPEIEAPEPTVIEGLPPADAADSDGERGGWAKAGFLPGFGPDEESS